MVGIRTGTAALAVARTIPELALVTEIGNYKSMVPEPG